MSSATLRPTGVTIVAWLWIVAGGLMVFSAIAGGLLYSTMRDRGSHVTTPHDVPIQFKLAQIVFDHFGSLLIVQFLVALLAIVSGIHLLRLHPWARTAIEILSWLAFIYSVGFGIYWVYMWVSVTGNIPQGASYENAKTFRIMGAAMGIVVISIFAVPLGIMIRYLRGPVMRAAVTHVDIGLSA